MNISSKEKISFRVDGKLITLVLKEEFAINPDNLHKLPLKYAYLKSLEVKLLHKLREVELEKDKYFSVQFLIIKEDGTGRPPSDLWVKEEIMSDEAYLELVERHNQAYRNYKTIQGIVRSYQNVIDVTRTIAFGNQREFNNY